MHLPDLAERLEDPARRLVVSDRQEAAAALREMLAVLRVAQDAFKGWRDHPFGLEKTEAMARIDALLAKTETTS